jgi:hypothetical protein
MIALKSNRQKKSQSRGLLFLVLLCLNIIVAMMMSVGDSYAADTKEGSSGATAAANGSGTGKSPKHTSINFEDQLVEGQTQKPELFYLLQQRNTNFKRLIRLRENFLPEMRKTAEDIGRPSANASGKGNGQ